MPRPRSSCMAADTRLQECLACINSIGRDKGDRCDESFISSMTEDVGGYGNIGDGKCHAFKPRSSDNVELNANCARCENARDLLPGDICIGNRTIGTNEATCCPAFFSREKPRKPYTGMIHLTEAGMDECAEIVLDALKEYPEKMSALLAHLNVSIDELKNRRIAAIEKEAARLRDEIRGVKKEIASLRDQSKRDNAPGRQSRRRK